ncbi:hypothetical protein DRQ15_02520, partial [candidate division KSB1 bacterium]
YIALGGASTANAIGVEAIYWNPAGVARSTNAANVMFSHMLYIADISVDYLAVEANFDEFGHVGVSIKALGFGDIEITTADNPDGTGQKFSPTFFTLGVTYARMLIDRVAVGVNFNIIREQIPRAGATGLAFDAGVQYIGLAGIQGLNLGLSMKNIGPPMTYDGSGLNQLGRIEGAKRPVSSIKLDPAPFELPSIVELGLSYDYRLSDLGILTVSYLFKNHNFAADENKLGFEFNFRDQFFLRGGYSLGLDIPSDYDYIFGPTFGAGLVQNFGGLQLSLDYAYRTVEFFNTNHVFALKLGF